MYTLDMRTEPLTPRMIELLSREAGEAGDTAMVQICSAASYGNDQALEDCAAAINAARAMYDEPARVVAGDWGAE